jgi:WD40 repeat protein
MHASKLAYAPGGPARLASSSIPWDVQIFDVASKRKFQHLKRPETVSGKPFDRSGQPNVEKLTFSPDGTRLAASTSGNSLFLWDVSSGDLVAAIEEGLASGWTEGRCVLAFTPDGASLVTASRGLKDPERIYARKRDATTGELVSQIELTQPDEPFPYIYPRVMAPDGRFLAGVGEFRGGPENSCYESLLVIYDLGPLFGASMSPSP